MTGTEESPSTDESPAQAQPSNPPATTPETAEPVAAAETPGSESDSPSRRSILIGSQRDPAAYRARQKRDWTPIEGEDAGGPAEDSGKGRHRGGRDRHGPGEQQAPASTARTGGNAQPASNVVAAPTRTEAPGTEPAKPQAAKTGPAPVNAPSAVVAPPAAVNLPPVNLPPVEPLPEVVIRQPSAADDDTPVIPGKRQKLTAAMEAELDQAMAGVAFDELMSGAQSSGQEGTLEPESRHRVRVVAIRREEIFVEFSGREQGCIATRSFENPPEVGAELEVIVQRLNPEEGLYDVTLPGASVDLGNWDDVREGMLVDAQVTGHNTGGLECEVNHIPGFIPVSQISLYRVEDLAQFVGQHFACLITDANRQRKNLVLSRRAVLEREKEEKKEQFFSTLAPGQVHDGTVRKLMDFGAFVELGNGIDGLLHVSQLSWSRVKHPSEVLQEGQPIRVRIEKVDQETGRIGLSYRDMLENPWTVAAGKYLPNTTVRGKVTRLMEFGAFVELEPGIEGLIHVSELSFKRIWRPSDVVKEGEEIEVMVLKVDLAAQRMSLSLKALHKPEPTKKEKEEAEAAAALPTKKQVQQNTGPLKGGLGKTAGGESFGLKW